jgi:predicted metal-binding membrane protein
MTTKEDDFRHLDFAGRAAAAVGRNPRAVVVAILTVAIALAWAVVAAMAIRSAEGGLPGAGSPGDSLLRLLPALPLPEILERFVALCLTPLPAASWLGAELAVLTLMWFLMAVAAMLPSAAPMIRTYCEIADTAKAKGERAVHPLVLVSGYLLTWLAASIAFAAATLLMRRIAPEGRLLDPVGGLAGAAALALAGAYQFSSLKEACLTKCRNPFAVLFARWSDRPVRIFRLGLEQGIWCLGCCWALMLVMFAVGIANIFWMALIGLFALVEKQMHGWWISRFAGSILLVWAVALLVVSR